MMNRIKILCFLLLGSVLFSCSLNKKTAGNTIKKVKIETEYGNIVIKLYNETPLHRDNFIKLVKDHYYDGLLFHRIIKNFMIQGGDPNSKNAAPGELLGDGGLPYTIPAEFNPNLYHMKGALAAAREGDDVNPKRESSSTQFYLVEGKTYTDAEMDKMEAKFNIKIPESHRQVYRTIGGTPFLDMKYTVFGEVESGLEVISKIAALPKDANDRPLKDVRMKIRLIK